VTRVLPELGSARLVEIRRVDLQDFADRLCADGLDASTFMIAAGVNAKALSSYMGHSSVTITYDRCGHQMPGSETEAAELLDCYLARSLNGARAVPLPVGTRPGSLAGRR
jgi:hypothetical protein